jgi:hypothetical protein
MYLCMFEGETLGDGARCAVGSIPEGLGGVGFFPWGGERFFSAISSRCMLLLYLKTNTHDLKKKKKKKKKKWLAGEFGEETLGHGARCAVGSIPEGLGKVGFFPWGRERFFRPYHRDACCSCTIKLIHII